MLEFLGTLDRTEVEATEPAVASELAPEGTAAAGATPAQHGGNRCGPARAVIRARLGGLQAAAGNRGTNSLLASEVDRKRDELTTRLSPAFARELDSRGDDPARCSVNVPVGAECASEPADRGDDPAAGAGTPSCAPT